MVERCVRDAEAVGSSPATSTIFFFQLHIEVWLSLVERCVRDAEAVGSSPATSTIFYRAEILLCFFVAVSRPFHSSPPLLKILRIYDMIPKDIIWKGISHL